MHQDKIFVFIIISIQNWATFFLTLSMHRSFISFIRQKLKFYILFGISLEMMALLEIINFSKVMIIKTSFISDLAIFFCLDAGYWDSLTSLSLLVNVSNILTCFGGFSDCL